MQGLTRHTPSVHTKHFTYLLISQAISRSATTWLRRAAPTPHRVTLAPVVRAHERRRCAVFPATARRGVVHDVGETEFLSVANSLASRHAGDLRHNKIIVALPRELRAGPLLPDPRCAGSNLRANARRLFPEAADCMKDIQPCAALATLRMSGQDG